MVGTLSGTISWIPVSFYFSDTVSSKWQFSYCGTSVSSFKCFYVCFTQCNLIFFPLKLDLMTMVQSVMASALQPSSMRAKTT